MSTNEPAGEGSSPRRALAQTLLAAAIQGLTRAVVDVILGGGGKGLL